MTTSPTPADTARAREHLERSRAAARAATTVTRLTDAPVPDGFAAWRVGAAAPVVLPALRPLAPLDVHRRYLLRVVATARGDCPACGARAGVVEAERTPDRPAAWHALPLHVGLTHEPACPAAFSDPADRVWFLPWASPLPGETSPDDTEMGDDQS